MTTESDQFYVPTALFLLTLIASIISSIDAKAACQNECPAGNAIVVSSLLKASQPLCETNEITLIRYATVTVETHVTLCEQLDVGDEVNNLSDVYMEISCPRGSTVQVEPRSRYTIEPPGRSDCAIRLLAGSADVQTSSSAPLSSGMATAGEESTEYGLRISRDDKSETREEWFVHEGQVTIQTKNSTIEVPTGKKLSIGIASTGMIVDISPEDRTQTADLHARLGAGKAELMTKGQIPFSEAYKELFTSYSNVLAKPDASEPRIMLSAVLLNFRSSTEALYHLNHAEKMAQKDDPQELATIAVAKSVAFKQLSRMKESEFEMKKATKIDPGILNTENVKRFHLDQFQLHEPFTVLDPTSAKRATLMSAVKNGQYRQAIAGFQELLKTSRPISTDYYAMALAYYGLRDYPRESYAFAKKAIQQNREDNRLAKDEYLRCAALLNFYFLEPARKTISVSATTLWQDTGLRLYQGQKFSIKASGRWANVSGDQATFVGPNGWTNYPYQGTLLASANLASLVGKIEDIVFAVGENYAGNSSTAGELFLSMNDTPGTFDDNQGELTVEIAYEEY